MSQPGYRNAPGRAPAPLRVTSERLTDDEGRATSAGSATTIAPTGPVPVPPAVGDGWGPPSSAAPVATSSAPVVARPSLPVVAPRPRRRLGEIWRLVFARRRAGRHRPETTPPQGWSMFAPQRRPGRRTTRRWGRR